jgi:polyvinyl alcohol dehydrogenase (cytochrome)
MRQYEKAIQSRIMRPWMAIMGTIVALALVGLVFVQVPKQHAVASATGDWPTFLSDNARTGYNANETTITTSTAPNLHLTWTYSTGGSISTQSMEANNMVYWGSWDGNEYAADLKGNNIWSTPISPLTPDCLGNTRNFGVGSPATIATEPINGMTSVLYVGSSDGHLYALNAITGAIIWETSLSSVPHTFLWSNPLVYNGSVYIGISSVDDCPLVQGGIAQVNAVTGTIEHIFYDVPAGCLGGSIWSSPAVDEATGMIYVATGNAGACHHTPEIYASALLEFRASDLTLVDSWQVPASQLGADSDFGATLTLFTATVQGSQQAMLGVQNKNGIFYALKRASLHNGPVWQASIGTGRRDIVSDAFDGAQLYVASLNTTINGKHCYGSLRALDPATGAFNWQDCLKGPVNTAVSVVPGVAFVGAGKSFLAMDTGTGKILLSYKLGNIIYGSASISNGVAYIGDASGTLYAFGI